MATFLWVGGVFAQDFDRALRNYQAIASGQKTFQELSPTEQREVIWVIKLLGSSGGVDNGSGECRDARSEAQSAADDLERRAKKLMRCAKSENFDDDCRREFRKVKSAHRNYESAVSEVQSYCN